MFTDSEIHVCQVLFSCFNHVQRRKYKQQQLKIKNMLKPQLAYRVSAEQSRSKVSQTDSALIIAKDGYHTKRDWEVCSTVM